MQRSPPSPPFHSLINAAFEFNEAFTAPIPSPHDSTSTNIQQPPLLLYLAPFLSHLHFVTPKLYVPKPPPFPWESAKPLMHGIAHQKKLKNLQALIHTLHTYLYTSTINLHHSFVIFFFSSNPSNKALLDHHFFFTFVFT